jgi:hypothetical protein
MVIEWRGDIAQRIGMMVLKGVNNILEVLQSKGQTVERKSIRIE